MVPEPVADRDGLFIVDATWGTVRPIKLAPGVETVGELEVIEHIYRGLPLMDCRRPHFFRAATLPTASSLPHPEAARRIEQLDSDVVTVMFCNGPQCASTPDAIHALTDAGYPPQRLLYYRGGMHDWLTLGFPTVPGETGE